ncbi:MAG: aldo/keto reductase [Candidatus Micrarchaeota archaeon]|nr:aldo/keto reductase [Candidatus Micrarchaeota archaeon]MDE1848315.1 aldo/keto reductase [Candidatus Micrarchaeota archaeon]MDE1864541.1 aldo/keto reductase [Candidatus Micrarchaeota archaeon]
MSSETSYKKLGNSDLEVSKLAFGTYRMISKSEPLEAIELIKKAFRSGINFFATSDNYHSEMLVGKAISDLPREKVVIATMTGLPITQYHKFEVSTSSKRINEQVDKSRKILGVDTIDLYQTHAYDQNTPMLEVVSTMSELVEKKKIRYYGFSNYDSGNIIEAIGICKENGFQQPISLQNHYNLIGWQSEDAIITAQKSAMSILAYSPLYNGYLTRGNVRADKPPKGRPSEKKMMELENEFKAELRKLDDLALDYVGNMQQLALAWLMGKENTIPMLGAYTQEHLDDLLGSLKIKIEKEDLDFIEKIRDRLHEIYVEILKTTSGRGQDNG